jgi:hypothetical protein
MVALPSLAIAQTGTPTPAQLLGLIKAQQKQLNELKAVLETAQKKAEEAAIKADKAEKSSSKGIAKSIDVGGVIEVEASSAESFANVDSSDITLAKVELFVDVAPTDYLNTHVQLIYEDDGTETINLDEAFAILGNTEKFPLYLQAGKWAIPFGNFDTAMVTDPLTKDLGETVEKTVLAGVAWQGITLDGYVYNGDTQKSGSGNNIDQFGVALGYGGEIKGATFNIGGGYINNFGDSDGITSALGGASTALDSYVGGLEIHASAGYQGFTLLGGYMTAREAFLVGELAFNGQGAEPKAWNLELSYTVPIAGKDVTFAAGVEGTDEALALSLPETRVGGAISVGVMDNVALTAEYLRDEDYGTGEGGTGRNGHTVTVQLAAGF